MAIINQSPAGQVTLTLTTTSLSSMVLGANDPAFSETFFEYNISANGATISGALPVIPQIPSSGQIWPLGLV